MNCRIDPNSSCSAYMQLYAFFRSEILRGVYPYGTKLPSKRTVAADTGVSVITVEHAYGILCDEGYLEARTRSGYFVIYRSDRAVAVSEPRSAVLLPPAKSVVDDCFPFSLLARRARKVLTEYGERLLERSPNQGCLELREALSSYLARSRGICIPSERIVIGSGAEYLYGLVVQMLGRTRRYAVEDPCYEKILRVYRANGASCDRLRMGTDGVRSDELQRTDAAVLHVTPFNSFPSGITATASKRAEYVRWAAERGGFIVEDDFDSEYTVSKKNEDTVYSLDPHRVIYMNTFSRTVAPSIRVGYMVLAEGTEGLFQKTVGDFSCTVPTFEQFLLAELLENGDFERHVNRVRRKRRSETLKK